MSNDCSHWLWFKENFMCKRAFLISLYLFGFFMVSPISAQEWWKEQPSGTTRDLRAVYALSENTAVAVGFGSPKPTILRTTNGGEDWAPVVIRESLSLFDWVDLRAVNFVGQHGWAVGLGSTSEIDGVEIYQPHTLISMIYYTTDGGASWDRKYFSTSMKMLGLRSIQFVTEEHGWIVDTNGTMWRALDGKAPLKDLADGTWEKVPHFTGWLPNTGRMVTAAHFHDAGLGWAIGWSNTRSSFGEVSKTTDGGRTWSTLFSSNTLSYPLRIQSLNQKTLWAGPAMRVSRDGGASWSNSGMGSNSSAYGSHFVDTTNGWVISDYQGGIYRTSDGGESWRRQTYGTTVSALHLSDGRHGWAVGGQGKILKYSGEPSLRFKSFHKDSVWLPGTTHEISWSGSDAASTLTIQYFDPRYGGWHDVALQIPTSTGKYSWTVPSRLSSSTWTQFRLYGNLGDGGMAVLSDTVSLVEAPAATLRSQTDTDANLASIPGAIRISLRDASPLSLILYDMQGKAVWVYEQAMHAAGTYTIQPEILIPSGTYIAILRSQGNLMSRRLAWFGH
jgi:photosystem II stability/assembly factor-like uncharacterized protein